MSDEETRWSDDLDEQPDLSHAVSERPLRRRWLVFSFLIGVSLAAGVATFILVLRGFIDIVRSPLPVSDESWCIWAVLIAMVALCVGWAMRPSKRLTAGSFWGAAIILALTTVVAHPIIDGFSEISRSGMSVPRFVGQLITAWGCFSLAILANIAGRAYGRTSLPSPGSRKSSVSSESDDDVELDVSVSDILSSAASKIPVPRESQHEESEESGNRRHVGTYAQRLGLGVVGVATATALAVTAPTIINKRLDPFIYVTASALPHHEGVPTVEKIVTANAGQNQPAAAVPVWTVSFEEGNVKQILAGVRGAVVITDRGVYGLDSATGESTWSFSTVDLKESSHESDVRSLIGVDVYAGESAFTSPNGAWLAYAFDVTSEDSAGSLSPLEDLTRIVVLNTDTGRIALDTQVVGSAPTVQLTDSTAVINRRVYDIASGRELTPLDDEKVAISGPGGHSTVLALRKEEDLSRSSWASVDTLSDQYLRAVASDRWAHDDLYDDIHAQVIDGRIINVGGWVVNDIDKGAIQNIDTGGTVSLNNKGESSSWRIVGIEASAQAVSTWSVQDYVDGDAKNYGHPLELNVFDTRTGKVTTVDPAGTYRTVFGGGRASGISYSGAVDTALFSARVDDDVHVGIYDDLVVEQNDAARQHDVVAGRSGSHPEPPWVSISLPQFSSGGHPVALCPGGMIVSLDRDLSSDSSQSTVSARKAI
jgi:membrane protein